MQVLTSYHSAYAAVGVATATPQPASSDTNPSPAAEDPGYVKSSPGERNANPWDTAAGATSMKYRRSDRTSLYIETQEGDVVRVKLRARESFSLEHAYAEGGGESTSDTSIRARSAMRLSISVRGELSAEELEAIQGAVDQATGLAEDFFADDLQAAFEGAADLGIDGDQLASVKLRMRSTESLTYSTYGYARPALAALPSIDELQKAEADVVSIDEAKEKAQRFATTLPVVGPFQTDTPPVAEQKHAVDAAKEPADHAGTAGDAEPPPVHTAAQGSDGPEAVKTGAEAAEELFRPDAGLDAVKIPSSMPYPFDAIGLIDDFLDKLLDSAMGGESTSRTEVSLKLRVFQATLATLSDARTPAEPVPALVHDTVEALAARHEGPVDQVA